MVKTKDGKEKIHLDGNACKISLKTHKLLFSPPDGHFENRPDIDVNIVTREGQRRLALGEHETISLDGEACRINLRTQEGKETLSLDGNSGNLIMGGNGKDGDIIVKAKNGKEMLSLNTVGYTYVSIYE